MNRVRLHFIDVAKGIGIILIIGLHTSFHYEWMINFEMPLFFILSGIFFKPYPDGNFKIALVKMVNTLIVPYLFFEAPKFIYDTAFFIKHRDIGLINSIINSSVPTTTWFLLSLFEAWLLCQLFTRLTDDKLKLSFAGILCAVLGYAMWKFNIPNFLFIGASLTLLPYLVFGYICRESIIRIYPKALVAIIGLIGLLMCYLLTILCNGVVQYRSNTFDSMPLLIAILCAISGSLGIIFISKLINQNKYLEYYGKNSLIILGSHLYFVTAISRMFSNIPNWRLFIVVLFLVIPLIYILKRFFPRLCGVKPLLKSDRL